MLLEGNFSQSKQLSLKLVSIFTEFSFRLAFSYLGVVVDLHTRLRVDVLGADNLTVPLQRLQLKELCCGQELRGRKKKNPYGASVKLWNVEGFRQKNYRRHYGSEEAVKIAPTSITSEFLMCRESVPPK